MFNSNYIVLPIIFFAFIFSNATFSMESPLELEVFKGGKKMLMPLSVIAKEITRSQGPFVQNSDGLMKDCFKYVMNHPTQTALLIGYGSLILGIFWYVKSEKCILTPWTSARMEKAALEELDDIHKEEEAIYFDALHGSDLYNKKNIKDRDKEATAILIETKKLEDTIVQNYKALEEAQKSRKDQYSEKQKTEFNVILELARESSRNSRNTFLHEKQKVEEGINSSLDSFTRTLHTTSKILDHSFEGFSLSLESCQKERSEKNGEVNKKIDLLTSLIPKVCGTINLSSEIKSHLDNSRESLQNLSLFSDFLDKQKNILLEVEETILKNKNRSFTILVASEEN